LVDDLSIAIEERIKDAFDLGKVAKDAHAKGKGESCPFWVAHVVGAYLWKTNLEVQERVPTERSDTFPSVTGYIDVVLASCFSTFHLRTG
jgi:hypothetical protein